MEKIIVVGGGPAGMMAAIAGAEEGSRVTLLEKMDRVGRKLAITGHGRCNITADVDMDGLIRGFPGNGRFLHSAFSRFSNQDLIAFLARIGVPTKTEAGGRVFPFSENAQDVVSALRAYSEGLGVEFCTGRAVRGLLISAGACAGIKTEEGQIDAGAVIIATGGLSYPGTGSSGDGYRWAEDAGHRIVAPRPSLVPLLVAEEWIGELQGVSLQGIQVNYCKADGKKLGRETGDLIFTHYGLSGPVILAASKDIGDYLARGKGPALVGIDLFPDISVPELREQLQGSFSRQPRRQLKNALAEYVPSRLGVILLRQCGLDPERECGQITRGERQDLTDGLKAFRLTVTGTRPIAEAIVTAGGVDVRQVEPATMASRLIRGLFFAGEVLDVDGYTGGYNLQAAFSTGYAAGKGAAMYLKEAEMS